MKSKAQEVASQGLKNKKSLGNTSWYKYTQQQCADAAVVSPSC